MMARRDGVLLLLMLAAAFFGVASGQVWISFVALAAAVVLLLAGRRGKAAGPKDAKGPVPLPPEEIELEEGPIAACIQCGSPDVRLAGLREGGIPGAGPGHTWVCGRCGHRGPALEFDDPTAYREFVKGLHGADR